MAPEVISDSPYTEKCDVYSFGIILWELLFEQIPFSDYNVLILPGKILGGLRPEIPQKVREKFTDYCKLMESCWQTDASKRPSFQEILKQLKIMKDNQGLRKSLNEFQKTLYSEQIKSLV